MNIDYNQKNVYVGIDVHKKSFSIAVYFCQQLIKKATVPADGKKLAESLRKWLPDAIIYSAYEAGFSGFGLHRVLIQNGIKNIVVNAASIEVAANDKTKTDPRDAKKIAEQLAAGRLRCIYIPEVKEELRRQITRTRDQIVEEKRRVTNKIKGKLLYFGILAPEDERPMSEKFISWIESIYMQAELRFSLNLLIAEWRLFARQLKDIQVDLQIQSFEDAECAEIYSSVPGIGLVGARILANELGDLSIRFRNQKALYQYTGLTPSEHSSGENIHRGNIDRQGSARIRCLLTEAAWTVIKHDGALRECFERIAARRGKKIAIVAIARKLIGRLRACFLHKQTYITGLVA